MLRSNQRVPRRLAVLAVGLAAVLAVPVGSSAAVAAVQPATTAVSSVAAAPVVGFPGNQVNYQYDSVRLQMTAGGGTTPYAWSAVSLPLGLTINPSTGLISGLLRGSGTRTVTVSIKDAAGATASTTFTWRVIRDACPRC
ncbi:Ig domain-containing protein [Streptomyces sp. NBC_01443]|uniref:Ig domain-containing protein n=1 Tax=Streptomyces sp. NBC_01443 TaxID=2903868 RepID=UPI00224D9600|nr:Ig domain-containing protein [Streptomyces sp. NBC_01443]MCX4625666.1 Ig domain-containing protein [Streptomyces sp. NBC_01443]